MAAEAAQSLKLKKAPKVILMDSEWPEAISVNKKYLAVSTGLVDIMKPEEVKAMMVQQLEARNHGTGRFMMKWVVDPALIVGGAAGVQHVASKKIPILSFSNWADPKSQLVTAATLGTAKFAGWETLERWKDRKHEIQQDAVAAKISGQQTVVGALEAIDKREEELKASGEPTRWTVKHLPRFLHHKPETKTRIAELQKHSTQDFTTRVSTPTPNGSSTQGRS